VKVTDRSGPVVPGLRPAAICELTDNQPATACTSAIMSLRNSTSHWPPSDGVRLAVPRGVPRGTGRESFTVRTARERGHSAFLLFRLSRVPHDVAPRY
jgi:hypothetical protein